MDSAVEQLCDAAQAGDSAKVKSFLGSGASVNARDRGGFTVLHRCCVGGSPDAASVLLARGASVNATDEYGDTSLHVACHGGNANLVRVLLAAGANALCISSDGRTPLSVAIEEGHQAIANLLFDHLDRAGLRADASADVDSRAKLGPSAGASAYQRSVVQLGDAAYAGDMRAVNALLSAGVDVNGADADGFSALHRAAAAGNVGVAECLLAHGADPNARDVVGCAPLHYAAFAGHTDTAYILVTAGADANRRNRDGLTASDVAKSEGRESVVKLLSSAWTRAENLDFAHGVVLEGELTARRTGDVIAASLFRWKQKYAVLSRHYRALFLWSGTALAVEGPVTRLRLDNVEDIAHDAKAGSKKFTVKPTKGEPLELAAASGDDAAVWVGAIRALQVALQEEDSKTALLRQLISSEGAVAVAAPHALPPAPPASSLPPAPSAMGPPALSLDSLKAALPLPPAPLPLSGAPVAAPLSPALSPTLGPATSPDGGEEDAKERKDKKDRKDKKEKRDKKEKKDPEEKAKAAMALQRVMRGWKARRLVKGWARVVDDADGDIFWYNAQTKTSSWFPPGRSE